jgi:hypothetical protein
MNHTTPASHPTMDERLTQAMTRLVVEDREALEALLPAVLAVTARYPAMVSAFACLVISELSLLAVPGLDLNDAMFLRLRSLAFTLADRLAEASAP